MGFTEATRRLEQTERAIAEVADVDPVDPQSLKRMAELLDELPALVWGASLASGRTGLGTRPGSFVVFGRPSLCVALIADAKDVEVEVTDDPDRAQELTLERDPDVVVVDADLPRGQELAELLTAPGGLDCAPLVVIGTFPNPEHAARFAALGAARVLTKPVSPDMLRRAVVELAERERQPRLGGEGIGDVTVAALAERIATEVRRGLAEAVEPGTDRVIVPLGDGTDVLAAVWSSVARIRELVTMRSGGYVRFRNSGPEGAVPIAPWVGGDRRAGTDVARRPRSEVISLEGRKVVVADDDPAVVWFMTDLLRQAGVEVIEAHDGRIALDRARQCWPDLVVSDVLMPELDGFTLCREIKRDPGIRDVPVILLSWKEDLLQRVRDLGSDADGYLRKEATASVVLERLREVLRARARVETRLDRGGEVKGRLDGISPRLVLHLVCERGLDARVAFRDAVYLYEVEIRDGRPRTATRTAADGRFDRGIEALGALLGVSAGRFAVTPNDDPCDREFEGTLQEILEPIISAARLALYALAAERLPAVERVEFDPRALAGYLEATPGSALTILQHLMAGTAPRSLLQEGGVSPRLLEAVLADAARHGAVTSVVGIDGSDLLAAAAAAAAPRPRPALPRLELPTPSPVFSFELSPAPSNPALPVSMPASMTPAPVHDLAPLVPAAELESARALPAVAAPAAPLSAGAPAPSELSPAPPTPDEVAGEPSAAASEAGSSEVVSSRESAAPAAEVSAAPAANDAAESALVLERQTGSSSLQDELDAPAAPLESACEASAPLPAPESDPGPREATPQPMAPEEARPVFTAAPPPHTVSQDAAMASIDPVLPPAKKIAFPTSTAAPSRAPVVEAALPRAKSIAFPSHASAAPGLDESASAEASPSEPLGGESPELPAGEGPEVRASSPAPPVMPRAKRIAFPLGSLRRTVESESERVTETSEALGEDPTPDPLTPEPSVSTSTRDQARGPKLLMFGVSPTLAKQAATVARVGAITAGTALLSYFVVRNVVPATQGAPGVAASASAASVVNQAAVNPAPPVPAIAPTPPAAKKAAAARPGLPDGKIEELATPPGFALDADRGLLEVVTPDREAIHIDGEWMGRGPLRRYPIRAGKHQVEIKAEGQSRSFDLTVTAGKRTRLSLAGG